MILLLILTTLFNFSFATIPVQIDAPAKIEINDRELKNEVYSIAEEVLQIPKENLKIKQHLLLEDVAESGSQSLIFYINDAQGEPIAVMKQESINTDYYSNHEYEYLALNSLNKMNFDKFHPVRLYGVFEKAISEKVSNGYIVESVAKGKSLNGFVKEVGKEKDLLKREEQFYVLKRGVEKTALGLGELHSKKHYSHASSYFIEQFHDTEETSKTKIASDLPGPFGIIHGDLHLGNVFYDEDEDIATFIDFSSSYHSRNGGPIAQDLANFIITMEMLGSYHGLTQSEIKELNDVFLTAYTKTGPQVTDEAIQTYRKYFLLVYAEDISEWDDKQKEQAEFLYYYCKNELELGIDF